MKETVMLLVNLAILSLFSYIVFWRGHSGWWMLFAIVCLYSYKSDKED